MSDPREWTREWTGEIKHVALVVDGSVQRLYINGVQVLHEETE